MLASMADVVIDASALSVAASKVRDATDAVEWDLRELDAGTLGADDVADAAGHVADLLKARTTVLSETVDDTAAYPTAVAAGFRSLDDRFSRSIQ